MDRRKILQTLSHLHVMELRVLKTNGNRLILGIAYVAIKLGKEHLRKKLEQDISRYN